MLEESCDAEEEDGNPQGTPRRTHGGQKATDKRRDDEDEDDGKHFRHLLSFDGADRDGDSSGRGHEHG